VFWSWQADGGLKLWVLVQPNARCAKFFLRDGVATPSGADLAGSGQGQSSGAVHEAFAAAPTRVVLLSGATAKRKCFLLQPPFTVPTWLVDTLKRELP
jgi:hypothetical protein